MVQEARGRARGRVETLARGWTRASEDQGVGVAGLDPGVGPQVQQGRWGFLTHVEWWTEGQSRSQAAAGHHGGGLLTSPTSPGAAGGASDQGDFSRHPTFTGMKNVTSAVSFPESTQSLSRNPAACAFCLCVTGLWDLLANRCGQAPRVPGHPRAQCVHSCAQAAAKDSDPGDEHRTRPACFQRAGLRMPCACARPGPCETRVAGRVPWPWLTWSSWTNPWPSVCAQLLS